MQLVLLAVITMVAVLLQRAKVLRRKMISIQTAYLGQTSTVGIPYETSREQAYMLVPVWFVGSFYCNVLCANRSKVLSSVVFVRIFTLCWYHNCISVFTSVSTSICTYIFRDFGQDFWIK
jgi:hypothetical protein